MNHNILHFFLPYADPFLALTKPLLTVVAWSNIGLGIIAQDHAVLMEVSPTANWETKLDTCYRVVPQVLSSLTLASRRPRPIVTRITRGYTLYWD